MNRTSAPLAAPAPCPVHAWCVIDGQHHDHVSDEIAVTSPTNSRPAALIAHLLHADGDQPSVCLEGADLDAAQARREASKIRRFAQHLERLAGMLDGQLDVVAAR